MSVNYANDDVTPSLLEYADALRAACPEVFCMPSSTTETMRASGSNPRLTIITGTCKCTFISIPIFLSFPLSLALSLSLFLIFLYCIYYLSFIATFSSSFLTFTFLCSRDVFIIFYFISIAPY